jgi:hypothetical protein
MTHKMETKQESGQKTEYGNSTDCSTASEQSFIESSRLLSTSDGRTLGECHSHSNALFEMN